LAFPLTYNGPLVSFRGVKGEKNRSRGTNAVTYLASQTLYGVKFGLETTRALCEVLGHPERAYPSLLVAGTNGKGSVVAYVDAILRASGLRVGRYTSPHLIRVHERIVVNGREITERQLEHAVGHVRHAAETLLQEARIPSHPTYFETLTVAAFDHFRAQGVDVAVLEVGMGGRLDSTNVAEPVVSAIVTLAKDHEAFLGKTLPSIAREKAGVLRGGRPTILGRVPKEALAAIRSEARARRARLVMALQGSRFEGTGEAFTLRTPSRKYARLRPLAGAHQKDNLLVAIRLVEAAREAGMKVRLANVSEAIARTRWGGRLQWIAGDPPLLLDGAHNPAGAEALAAHLKTLGPFVLVFGVMGDKDIPRMARPLFPLADALVLTQVKVRRAASPRAIAAKAGRLARGAFLEPNASRALARARSLSQGRLIVVAGSLYLVGEVLTLLKRSRK
jgi:dihydrofolate synthase/folylpolyglutamate synthase